MMTQTPTPTTELPAEMRAAIEQEVNRQLRAYALNQRDALLSIVRFIERRYLVSTASQVVPFVAKNGTREG